MNAKLLSASVALLTTSMVIAQETTPGAGSVPRNEAKVQDLSDHSPDARRGELDVHVARSLIISNKAEIDLDQFALKHLKDDNLKNLTQQMIQDHQQFVQKLQKFANVSADTDRSTTSTTAATTPQERRQERQDRREERREERRATAETRRSERAGTATDVEGLTTNDNTTGRQTVTAGFAPTWDETTQLQQEVADRVVKSLKDALSKEDGKDFDKAFLGLQCGAHIGMLAKMEVLQDHVSPEFQKVVREGEQMTRQHKDRLEQAMKDIKKSADR